jgi:hypothetical protein
MKCEYCKLLLKMYNNRCLMNFTFMPAKKHLMKRILLLSFLLLATTSIICGQSDKSPIVKYLLKRGYIFPDSTKTIDRTNSLQKWPDTLYYNTVYKSPLLESPTIPIPFSSVEYIGGQYIVSPTISIGYGYTWFFGDFIFNENDKITVDPVFSFGVIADAALQNNFRLNKLAGFTTDLFIGFGPFSLFAGYDIINHSASIGLGARLDLYTVSQNSLHPVGMVKSVRKHKKLARPIQNE